MVKGAAHFFSRKGPRNLKVNTPFTVAGVRGTEFLVEVGDDQTLVSVFEGRVLAQNDRGDLALSGGQTAVAMRGQAPALRVVARPRDAVQWAIHYPPVLYFDPGAIPDGAGWQGRVRQSTDQYLAGDLRGAFASLEGVDEAAIQDPRFFAYRASLLLAVGSVDEATADIDRALALAPEDANALSLQTIIAIARNENSEALDISRRAVAANPDSAAARIALSYAQQASFDLYGARATVEEAVALAPNDALAWARLAELRSSFGDTDGALEAAERAASLEPNLSRTQTVLGFVHLTRVDTASARAAFDRAITLDQGDPLPRLGLGLAKIREGHLDEGGRDIEVAASLDANDATIRSYLGKFFFEAKQTDLDVREYATAKQLDPNNPTAYYYDAIAKQTTNRPVEALHDVQKAIELNDNRAVHRSALLLDSDLASRSASLGRIYTDLGFQNLALVEGWKSVNTDPTNYSAHRLLSDTYAALPRHEIARVSELLQSQLLQPSNLTAIQPRQGEGSLFLIGSGGPSTASTTEFNPLFERNRIAAQTTGVFGEDDTYTGEGIVSGIYDKWSVSAGYSGYWTDGFRRNYDQDDDIATFFTQYEFTPQTSAQGEFRWRDLEAGEREIRFFEDDFSPFLEEEAETFSGRLGLRHEFSPNHTVLGSYIFVTKDSSRDDFMPEFGPDVIPGVVPAPDFTTEIDREERANTVEGQYLFRSDPLDRWLGFLESVNVVAGGGYVHVKADETSLLNVSEFFIPPPFCFPSPFFDCVFDEVTDIQNSSPDVDHGNVYAYSHFELPANVVFTVGGSADFFDENDRLGSDEAFNPKVGATWNPPFSEGTTVRAAAFRTFKRTLVTDQTLEPTQVAGFNQFFDDITGTKAWRFGGAIDQKFTENIFGGVEASHRDLKVPTVLAGAGGSSDVVKADWDETLVRVYGFWTPFEWLALRAEYQYEYFRRDPWESGTGETFFAFKKVKTHRVPFGGRVFLPCGFGASFGATWVDQKGNFFDEEFSTLDTGQRDFWILDAAIQYRLPKRYGFVTFGINNFLDEDSTYQATDVRNPDIRPGRFIFGSVTLAFP
jgi:tetratricopeptide (TPR) repeat protein